VAIFRSAGGAVHFSGTYAYAMDAKGRVAVPARFRDQMAKAGETELVIAPAIKEPHLKLYPGSSWLALREKIEAIGNPLERQKVRRVVLSRAHDLSPDGQGRVLVPQMLRSAAGIGEEVVIVGDGDHVQLWSPARWDEALQASVDGILDAEALLADLGF
jgi:MraZ protein